MQIDRFRVLERRCFVNIVEILEEHSLACENVDEMHDWLWGCGEKIKKIGFVRLDPWDYGTQKRTLISEQAHAQAVICLGEKAEIVKRGRLLDLGRLWREAQASAEPSTPVQRRHISGILF
jgi:hypothetical protein